MNDTMRFLAATVAAGILAGCATAPQKNAKDTTCLKDTGSRIPADGEGCSAFGRSYSNDDMRRTGATTVGGALQLLDPSITVGH